MDIGTDGNTAGRVTAFKCQGCGGDVIAQNEVAYDLLLKGHPALCPTCRNPQRPVKWESYEAYLLSPEWRAKADERKRMDGHRCRICNSPEHLEIHHRTYDRIFDERMEDLTTLCATDHWLVTAYEKGLIKLPPRPERRPPAVVVVEPEQSNGRKRVYLEPIKAGW
jgi:hypothetical protein